MATLIDTYKKLKKTNEKLQSRVNELENERNTIRSDPYYMRAMNFRIQAKKTVLYKIYKYLRYGNSAEEEEQRLQTAEKEFHYDYMLNAYEYRFIRYKRYRNHGYQMDLKSIRIPCVRGLVSVILPVYNGEDYVECSIESVLVQTYENIELIIVDDGSTDQTPQIIDRYAALDHRIRVLHQENQKLPCALSNGFRMAHGEFYTWTSADNIMHPEFIAGFVSDLQKYDHTGMIYGNLRLIDEKGSCKTDFEWYREEGQPPEHVMLPKCCLELNTYANNYVGAAFMYRAVVAHVVEDYSAFKFGIEDYDYWMKVNELFVLRHTSFEQPEYSYRLHAKSLTSKDKELKITENRFKQMLWDEFRRNYFLKDTAWIVLCKDPELTQYQELLDTIKKHDQSLLNLDQAAQQTRNRYERFICVCFAGAFEKEPPVRIPDGAFKILVADTPEGVRDAKQWDAYVCRSEPAPSDRLEGYKGWYGIRDGQTLFAFADSKARSRFLYAMERRAAIWEETGIDFSIIISFHGNDADLENCLASIEDDAAQVIITGSCEKIQACSQKFGEEYEYVANVSENQTVWKNAAADRAAGKYLVFIEDTCSFAKGYFKNLKDIFQISRQIGTVFGSVEAEPRAFSEEQLQLLGKYTVRQDDLYEYNDQNLPSGYSFAVRYESFNMAGGFYDVLEEEGQAYFCDRIYFGLAMALYNAGILIYLSKECLVYRTAAGIDEKQLEMQQWLRQYCEYMLKINGVLPYNVWPEVIAREIQTMEEHLAADPTDSWTAAKVRCNKKLLDVVRADFRDKEKVDLNRDLFSRLV